LWGYEADVLTNDIAELIVAFGADDAVVVGHDWGGALAWMLASDHPQRVQRLIALNIPHPARFAEEIRRNGRQMLRSWYMGFFQLPLLPEALLRANDFALLEQVFRGQAVNKAAFSDADIAAYKEALRKPGALTGAINYYRGLFQARLLRRTWPVITAPTLMIWGEQDAALGKELVPGTERYVANLQTRFIPQASHWVQQDAPELVNQYLLAFLRP
jgi:epoxide hydrolase 4